jgi:hypothetical protein
MIVLKNCKYLTKAIFLTINISTRLFLNVLQLDSQGYSLKYFSFNDDYFIFVKSIYH